MKKRFVYISIVLSFSLFSCEENDGRVLVTTGNISPEISIGYLNANNVIGADGTIHLDGTLPDGYEIESAGIVYGIDSSELQIVSCRRYGGVGEYDSYFGCFRSISYNAAGRSSAINIKITDTTFSNDGNISILGYSQIYGGNGSFTCPLINLSRQTKYYLRAFAHISDGKNENRYAYGETKAFVSGGIYEDPTVYVELYSLGIGVSKFDEEVMSGADAQRACYYFNSSGELGGYKNWRVPTLQELEEIYKMRNSIGGFQSAKYFSSQMVTGSDYYYWYWDFQTNQAGQEQSSGYGSLHGRVRFVRNI